MAHAATGKVWAQDFRMTLKSSTAEKRQEGVAANFSLGPSWPGHLGLLPPLLLRNLVVTSLDLFLEGRKERMTSLSNV